MRTVCEVPTGYHPLLIGPRALLLSPIQAHEEERTYKLWPVNKHHNAGNCISWARDEGFLQQNW